MVCEGLGSCKGVHEDVSCKPTVLGTAVRCLSWCCDPRGHVCPPGAEGCGIRRGWAPILLEPRQGFQAESNPSICCAYFLLTCVIKSKLPRTRQKKLKNERGWRLQPSCMQGEAVKRHVREALGLSHSLCLLRFSVSANMCWRQLTIAFLSAPPSKAGLDILLLLPSYLSPPTSPFPLST